MVLFFLAIYLNILFFSLFYLSLFLSLWCVNNYCELPHPQPPPTKTNKTLPITSLWTTTTALPPTPCEQTINPYPLPPTPTLCKDSFLYFPVFGSIKTNESKGKLYLLNIKKYSLFLEIIFRYFFFSWKTILSYSKLNKRRWETIFNTFKIVTKHMKMRQFYRKSFLQNNSYSRKYHCLNKQSVQLYEELIEHMFWVCSEFQILWEIYVIIIILILV